MAAEAPKPQLEVLSTSFSEVPDEAGELQPYTHVTFRDETGAIGMVVIQKKDPTDADIKAAVRKQREAEKARKPRIIPL